VVGGGGRYEVDDLEHEEKIARTCWGDGEGEK
jgi:hypothetical protein